MAESPTIRAVRGVLFVHAIDPRTVRAHKDGSFTLPLFDQVWTIRPSQIAPHRYWLASSDYVLGRDNLFIRATRDIRPYLFASPAAALDRLLELTETAP